VWNLTGKFALCSADHLVSSKNAGGEVIARQERKGTPHFIQTDAALRVLLWSRKT
jgi:hypothetical protein